MEFHFLNRNFELQGMVSTDEGGTIRMDDDVEKITDENGIIEFTGVVYFTDEMRDKVKRMTALGNYVVYKRQNGDFACVSIMETTREPLSGTVTIICEEAGLDLLNNVVQPEDRGFDETFEAYFNRAMEDTGFVLGENIYSGESRKLKFESENTAVERLRLIIEGFGGGKFKFEYVFLNNKLDKKIIHIVEDLGDEKPITLRVGREVNGITTTGSIYEMMTAVMPFGNTREGTEERIGLSGYPWTDPDKRFEIQAGVLIDTQEAPKWSRIASNTNGLFTRAKTYDADNQADLLALALEDLRKNSAPIVNYEVDLAVTPPNLSIGDTISIADEDDELFLTGKVLEMTYSSARDESTVTLGDFKIQYGGLDQQLQQLADDFSKQFDQSIPAEVIITPSKQFFVDGAGTITLTATVKKGYTDITSQFTSFIWSRHKADNTLDTTFSATGKTITVTAGESSVYTYYCTVDY